VQLKGLVPISSLPSRSRLMSKPMVPMANLEEERLSKVASETSWVSGEARDGLLIELEYISKFPQRKCNLVTSITFKTNVKSYGPYGNPGGRTPFKSGIGKILNFWGSSGYALDRLAIRIAEFA